MICKDLEGFTRLWERRGFARICKTLGEDSQGFARLWEWICKETLGEDLQETFREDWDFGRGFARIHFGRGLCERIHFGKDLQLWGMIHETLGEDLQGFR